MVSPTLFCLQGSNAVASFLSHRCFSPQLRVILACQMPNHIEQPVIEAIGSCELPVLVLATPEERGAMERLFTPKLEEATREKASS